MTPQTELSINDQAIVYGFVDTGRFGDSIQDQYLKEFCGELSDLYSSLGMEMPAVVCDPKAYVFAGNYRKIIDMVNPEKDVFVYFKHPASLNNLVPSADLYVGTFSKEMKAPILRALEELKANYKTTPVGVTPMTVKIDMHSFATGTFHRKYVMQSLEYDPQTTKEIVEPEQLFRVKDTSTRSRF